MRSNVGSRINAMCDQVERFAERWSQLKPKEDIMEKDSSVCAAALATVKDRKAEFEQLTKEWEKLRWVLVCVGRGTRKQRVSNCAKSD